jgi:hypothetical protein
MLSSRLKALVMPTTQSSVGDADDPEQSERDVRPVGQRQSDLNSHGDQDRPGRQLGDQLQRRVHPPLVVPQTQQRHPARADHDSCQLRDLLAFGKEQQRADDGTVDRETAEQGHRLGVELAFGRSVDGPDPQRGAPDERSAGDGQEEGRRCDDHQVSWRHAR